MIKIGRNDRPAVHKRVNKNVFLTCAINTSVSTRMSLRRLHSETNRGKFGIRKRSNVRDLVRFKMVCESSCLCKLTPVPGVSITFAVDDWANQCKLRTLLSFTRV